MLIRACQIGGSKRFCGLLQWLASSIYLKPVGLAADEAIESTCRYIEAIVPKWLIEKFANELRRRRETNWPIVIPQAAARVSAKALGAVDSPVCFSISACQTLMSEAAVTIRIVLERVWL